MNVLDQFAFSKEDAGRFINSFHEEMSKGLKGEASSLKMLLSFVKRPKGGERGRFLAVDLGGTNFRVMAVELGGDRTFRVIANNRYAIPRELMEGKGEALFDFLALSVASFLSKNALSKTQKYGLGFTFSFPIKQTSVKTGDLILWTKGFSASGVVGKDVVCLLDQALKRAEIEGVTIEALANDTVGTLMTKSYQKPDCDLGVILGTGTNACYPETERCDGVVINTEWGNFNKFTRSPFDEELDRNSANQGKQLFEKAVSGMYLGEIFRLALCSMPQFSSDIINRPYSISSENLSQLATDEFDLAGIGLGDISGNDISLLKEVAGAISKRSARLASSAIASIVLWQDKGLRNKHVIAIDGSLFEKYPGYSREMESFLNEMLGDRSQKISFELAKDGSGVGAAIVAAVAAAKSGGEKQRRG